MGDVLYIQTDKNRKITDPHVRLGDISDLTSNNPEVLQRCKVLRVLTLESGKYGRYAVSVMKLIELIQKKEKQVGKTKRTTKKKDNGEKELNTEVKKPAPKKKKEDLSL